MLVCFRFVKKNKAVQDNIAYQTVNLNIHPNDPIYAGMHSIQYVGGWAYIDGGVNGIVVYRKTAVNSSADFVAIERTSTSLPNDPNARVKVQSSDNSLKDTISGSKWQIYDGSVISGASLNLRVYNTVFDGVNTISIRN